ncbi:MAG: response regulator [Peptococcaceae bacterium]|jgi:two-component system response regulator DctR|nr:response regulator [Peptococcaceae bacterium]
MTRILIIDDDADICYTMGEICSFAGWEVATAANGEEGVRSFLARRPDLVVVDYHMPVMDGLATVRRIREHDPLVPLVVLTVDERQEIADTLMDAGATDFALKPVRAPDLIARLNVNLRITELQRKSPDAYTTKGISEVTQRIIADFLAEHREPLSAEAITLGVGLAYQTVHRYLAYMEANGTIRVERTYGKVGRPRNFYHLP